MAENEASKGLICIVEDNKSIAKLFATVLKKGGYETIEFNDGKSALDWLGNNNPTCVLADILLPDMNGIDLLNSLRSLPDGGSLPVIAITGFAQPGDREKLVSAGFDGYLSKPINIQSFVSEIEEVVKNKLGK